MSNFLTVIPQDSLGTVLNLTSERAVAIEKIWKSPLIGAGTTAEVDTGFDLPAKCMVLDAWVEVTAFEVTGTTKTIDVGLLSTETNGDADGFIDGLSVATSVGLKRPYVTFNSGTDYPASNTRGVLLSSFTAGSAADDRGLYFEKPAVLTATPVARSVSYSRGDTLVEFRGYIYIRYLELL